MLGSTDTSWSHPANRHSIFYASLTPGRYLFEVKAQGWNMHWGRVARFSFQIHPPFWQTVWFITGLFLTVTGLVLYWMKTRIRSIRRVAEMKQQIAETEMMALRAQMNPHFIFNCMNSIDALIQSDDKYHATVYLNKFARLLRNMLDSSSQSTIPFAKDLETLQLYIDLEQLREDDKFTVTLNVDPLLLTGDFKVPPLIIQPYVENAIIHGLKKRKDKKGRLLISIFRLHEYVEYIIEDNGPGRSAGNAYPHTPSRSYGMKMSRDRVKLFNNEEHASVLVTDLEEKGKPAGTRIRVQLKIQS